jgi:hypothetical protein
MCLLKSSMVGGGGDDGVKEMGGGFERRGVT